MNALSFNLRLLWDALFLQHEAYETLRDDNNPFVEGLFILVVVGLLVALASLVGFALEWASSPNLAEMQAVVLSNLQQMEWYQQLELQGATEALSIFQRQFDMGWQIASAMTSPLTALASFVTKPLSLILGWLVLGVIAHALARLLGGTGNLGQTLGTTALAAAPQAVNLLAAIPFLVVAGVGTWSLLCYYMALRTVHDLSWPRAMWATVLTPLIVVAFLAVVSVLFAAIFGTALFATFTGGQ